MTNRDVLFTVMSEVSGKPIVEVAASFPARLNNAKMNQELTEPEAAKLLEELRANKAGIFQWAMQGADQVAERAERNRRN